MSGKGSSDAKPGPRPKDHECRPRAPERANAGCFTIIDGIVIPRWSLQPLRDSLSAAGHRVAYAVLRAPLAVCLERAGSRASNWLSDAAVVERLWHDFADLGPFETHVIDSGVKAANATADALAERLQNGLLL